MSRVADPAQTRTCFTLSVFGNFLISPWLVQYFLREGFVYARQDKVQNFKECITVCDLLSSGLLCIFFEQCDNWSIAELEIFVILLWGIFLFFLLQFPDYLPCSVCLQPAPRDVDKVRPMGHLCLSWLRKVIQKQSCEFIWLA